MGVVAGGVFSGGASVSLFGERRAFDVRDVKTSARGVVSERARKPTYGKEAFEFGFLASGAEVDDGNGVLGAVGDVEAFAVWREGEGVWRGAEKVGGAGFDPDGFDDLICFGVD